MQFLSKKKVILLFYFSFLPLSAQDMNITLRSLLYAGSHIVYCNVVGLVNHYIKSFFLMVTNREIIDAMNHVKESEKELKEIEKKRHKNVVERQKETALIVQEQEALRLLIEKVNPQVLEQRTINNNKFDACEASQQECEEALKMLVQQLQSDLNPEKNKEILKEFKTRIFEQAKQLTLIQQIVQENNHVMKMITFMKLPAMEGRMALALNKKPIFNFAQKRNIYNVASH